MDVADGSICSSLASVRPWCFDSVRRYRFAVGRCEGLAGFFVSETLVRHLVGPAVGRSFLSMTWGFPRAHPLEACCGHEFRGLAVHIPSS